MPPAEVLTTGTPLAKASRIEIGMLSTVLALCRQSACAYSAGMAALSVCTEVNVDGGLTKAGVAPSEVLPLAKEISRLPNLKLRGLMSIPELGEGFEMQKEVHLRARVLFEEMLQAGLGVDTLSMGMTADLEAAIHAGSTMVRVGTAVFGGR